MDENQTIDLDRVQKINIEEEMKKSYIDYSMSVIVARSRRIQAGSPPHPLRYARHRQHKQQSLQEVCARRW